MIIMMFVVGLGRNAFNIQWFKVKCQVAFVLELRMFIFFRHLASKNPLNFCKPRLELVFLFSAKSRMISDSLRCRSDLKSAQNFYHGFALTKNCRNLPGGFHRSPRNCRGGWLSRSKIPTSNQDGNTTSETKCMAKQMPTTWQHFVEKSSKIKNGKGWKKYLQVTFTITSMQLNGFNQDHVYLNFGLESWSSQLGHIFWTGRRTKIMCNAQDQTMNGTMSMK